MPKYTHFGSVQIQAIGSDGLSFIVAPGCLDREAVMIEVISHLKAARKKQFLNIPKYGRS